MLQLVRENLDPELLYEEAEELFDSWWESQPSTTMLNEENKKRFWQALTEEFGALIA